MRFYFLISDCVTSAIYPVVHVVLHVKSSLGRRTCTRATPLALWTSQGEPSPYNVLQVSSAQSSRPGYCYTTALTHNVVTGSHYFLNNWLCQNS